MPPTTLSQFTKTIAPGYRDIVGTRFKRHVATYSQVLNVETTERQYEDYFGSTSIPRATTKPEGQPISFYDPLEYSGAGGTKRLTVGAKAVGVQISRELWMDDLYKNKSGVRKSAEALADAFIETVEVDGADIFNSGFTYSATNQATGVIDATGAANIALFSASHTRADSGTAQANQPSTATGLSLSSHRAALIAASRYLDDRGNRINTRFNRLIVPMEIRYRADELNLSEYKPGGNDNDPNVSKGEVQIVRHPYLTSTTAHFYINSEDHWLMFLWRERPMLDSYDDRNSKVAKFTVWGRYATGPVWWWNTYGNAGA